MNPKLMFAQPLKSIRCGVIAERNIIVNYFDVASGNIKTAVCSHSSSAGDTSNHRTEKDTVLYRPVHRKKNGVGKKSWHSETRLC